MTRNHDRCVQCGGALHCQKCGSCYPNGAEEPFVHDGHPGDIRECPRVKCQWYIRGYEDGKMVQRAISVPAA